MRVQQEETRFNRRKAMRESDLFITGNFESLVAKFGGKYVGIVNEQVIAAASTPREVLEDAKKLGKQEEEVSLLKVPTEEELTCIL